MILNLAFSSISCCFYGAKIIFCFHIAKQFLFILYSLLCRFGVCVVCGTGSFLVPCFDFSPSLYECSGFIFLAPPPDFYTAAAKKRLECVTIHKPWQHEGTSSGCIEKYPFVCMYRCKSFLSGYLCSHLA